MDRIRHARRQLGLSQEELAKAAGVSAATIVQVELGNRRPQGRTLRKLAAALGVAVADLLEEEAYLKKARSPFSAERALAIAAPDDLRRAVEGASTAELKQTALDLAEKTKVPTREDLVRSKDNKEAHRQAHQRTMANYCIGVINVELDSRGVRSPVELAARRFNDAMTSPEELQEAQEEAG